MNIVARDVQLDVQHCLLDVQH